MSADGEDIEAALGKLLPGFRLRLSRLNLMENPAGGIPDFADKFSHIDRAARGRKSLEPILTYHHDLAWMAQEVFVIKM